MTVSDVLNQLHAERDERGMAHWAKLGDKSAGLESFGIGLTKLRKLAKQIGRNRPLSQALWQTNVHDAKVIALLIDDPAQITKEQAEQQVEQLHGGMLAHVFASCDATLAKTSFAFEIAQQWVQSDDAVRRACGYGLLYEASKWRANKAPSDAVFLQHIDHIDRTIGDETEQVRLAMVTALMGIGKRNRLLNEAALKVALAAGPIAFTSASGNCEPFDVSKHLLAAQAKL